jgi:hypothetical protein
MRCKKSMALYTQVNILEIGLLQTYMNGKENEGRQHNEPLCNLLLQLQESTKAYCLYVIKTQMLETSLCCLWNSEEILYKKPCEVSRMNSHVIKSQEVVANKELFILFITPPALIKSEDIK